MIFSPRFVEGNQQLAMAEKRFPFNLPSFRLRCVFIFSPGAEHHLFVSFDRELFTCARQQLRTLLNTLI